MNDDELLALIANYERASLGSNVAAGATISSTIAVGNQMTTLEVDRFNAINMYFARPLGNEVENRSQVVLPEVRDTIEWIMPQLMRMFVGSKNICRFEARGPDDMEQAQLESDVVNHIFLKDNNGFFVLHDFFKDALMLRNGYAKVYWQVDTEKTIEKYSGLTEQELPQILQPQSKDEQIEVAEQSESQVTVIGPTGPMPMSVFDIKIRRTVKKGQVKVECIAPEEMRVSARATEGLTDLPFVAHMTTMTRSELIQDGHPESVVNALATGRPNWMEMDALARNSVVDQMSVENPADRAMQEIEVRDVTIKVDYDGDGVAELRHILIAGDKILDNEEIEETPLASCSPIRMPHRHTGISYYDLLADLQVIKTTLFRQALDNLYLANNSRVAVDWQNVNIDDLLTSRPGGVVRTKGPPSESIMPIVQPSNVTDQALPALQYVDSLREMRTGVGHDTMGLDADALQDVTKGGQLAAMSAASLKIELVARLLGEGVKEIFRKIHSEIIRNQDQAMNFEIAGKWVNIDPSQWRKRTKMSVNVGLGSGSREESRSNLMLLANFQEKIAPLGLIGPKQAYATFKMGAEILGYENPEKFAMDPDSPEYQQHMQQMASQPPPPMPQVEVAKIKAASDQAVAQSSAQRDVLKLQGQLAMAEANLAAAKERANAAEMHAQNQAHQDRLHEAIQGHADRQVSHATDTAAMNAQMEQTWIKALAQIVSQQLKQNATANAGEVMEDDLAEVEGKKKPDQMGDLIKGMHETIQHLKSPKTATMPDGRKITIQ